MLTKNERKQHMRNRRWYIRNWVR